MKLKASTTIFPILTILSLVSITSIVSAQVYKSVDENGNFVFTDKPPTEDATPLELDSQSAIHDNGTDIGKPTRQQHTEKPKQDASTVDQTRRSPATLSRKYKDFALISPHDGESWRSDLVLTAVWRTEAPLQAEMNVNLYVDEQLFQSTSQQAVPLGTLSRGPHTMKADLLDSKNRIIAKSGPIKFNVFQPKNYPVRPNWPPKKG